MHSLISCYVFSIHIEKTFYNDKPYVLFKLSDNGVGYGKDMLDKLNCEESDLYEDYHVGITNLKRELSLFMEPITILLFIMNRQVVPAP